MKAVTILFTTAVCCVMLQPVMAGDLHSGCLTRPACGKVCKLVRDVKIIETVCYGCKCKDTCIPAPSKVCCKNCENNCCDGGCDGGCGHGGCCEHKPLCKFCWKDWIPCGCGKPVTVKKLTKYIAVKEVCSYHWEVVDARGCDAGPGCGCAYKPAPEGAQIGQQFELTQEEVRQVVHQQTTPQTQPQAKVAQQADITAPLRWIAK